MTLHFPAHIAVTETEYGMVLLDQKRGRYWKLNPTAGLVLDTLRGGGTEDDAAGRLTRTFAVDRDRAAADIAAVLAAMRAAGVVRS